VKILLFVLIGIVILAALAGHIMSHVEQPDYKVVTSQENIEIRVYPPMILAEVEVSGERKQAIREGFEILADYIFGNNTFNKNIEMTAPVTNELSEKMAMTAPVLQEQHMDKWKVRFVMPKKYSFETLPKPNSKKVTLIPLPARRFAVIRFSGLADNESIKLHTEELKAYIVAEKLNPIGGTVLAFYNPPWTIPFLRRNEVMIEVDSIIDSKFVEIHP
jgi:hypothetical protein